MDQGLTMEHPPVSKRDVHRSLTLELRNVSKSYGSVNAVDDISLSLAKGEFLTLLGPSGCGKTTLLNMIAGFFPPTAGSILIEGRDVTRLMPHQRNTGIVFQNYALFPHMNVAQNIAFGLEERRLPKDQIRQRVSRMMAMVNLPGFEDRKPSQLSGGQQQRVALARALVTEPQVLLLDEPFSALDKSLRTKMQIEIKQIQKKAQVATVFVTHDQSEALSMSDRIAVMNKGNIEQIGAPQDIYRHPQSRFVASFVGEINRIPVRNLGTSGDAMQLEGPGGLRLLFRGRSDGIAVGGEAELYVRPEDVMLLAGHSTGADELKATVVACSYQGSFTHVVLAAPGLDALLVAAPAGPSTDTLVVGDEVTLSFDLARASLLPV
ncbi:MAG: ABC transporter ATP-binding protein [Rhizobiaceae bacterium]|jgi:ABC-type Fe3+/spermidine/putrescine transport system ATPase subunit